MFWKNFITLLRRYTASSLLNIIGMSVAFASVYLLMVQVTNDLSYNKKIPDADLIYRLEYPSWSKEGYWGRYGIVFCRNRCVTLFLKWRLVVRYFLVVMM